MCLQATQNTNGQNRFPVGGRHGGRFRGRVRVVDVGGWLISAEEEFETARDGCLSVESDTEENKQPKKELLDYEIEVSFIDICP